MADEGHNRRTAFLSTVWARAADRSVRALALSLLALSVPITAAFLFPSDLEHYEALLWLLALVPAFLLAFHRGWKGAATALALGMALISVTYAVTQVLGHEVPETLFPVVVAYLAITLGLGWFGQELGRNRELARQPVRILDPETELPTWVYAERYLEGEFEAARRGRPLVVIVFELTPRSRPSRQPASTDAAVLRFAEVLRRNTRSMNISARQSAAERRFMSVLSGGTLAGATFFAERVLARYHTDFPGSRPVSAGVAFYQPDMRTVSDLVAAAEAALQDALDTGGDRVRTAGTVLEVVSEGDENDGIDGIDGGGAVGDSLPGSPLRLETTPASRWHSALAVGSPERLDAVLSELERRGLRVTTAATAAEATRSLHRGHDLLVVDAAAEGSVQLVRAVCRDHGPTQVLALTDSRSSRQGVDALNAGAAYCLVQPAEPAEVESAVDEVLQRRDQRLRESLERLQITDELGARHREALRTLRETEARYRTVVEGMGEVVFQVDVDGRWTFLNAAWEKLFTLPIEEAIGTPFVDVLHPAERTTVQRELQDLFQGRIDQIHTPARLHGEDGRERWVALSASPSLDSRGGLTGAFGTMVEITERRHLEEQLRHAQKMEAVGQLAGGIAHDFNNLLMAIRSHAEFVLEDGHATPAAGDDLRQIVRGADRAADLTRQLLAFSRKQVLQSKVLDLGTTLRGMDGMIRRLLGEDIDINIDLPAEAPTILADEGQIQQVVLNLAVNARDAMPGGGRLTIRVETVANGPDTSSPVPAELDHGDFVCLAVQDSGTGMAPEVADRIFEPFFTTKGQGQGTGLGLATVYGIVKQSGGHIHVDSREGFGTTFHIYLPRVAPLEASAGRVRDAGRRKGNGETVLVVEDEDAVRSILRRILRRNGYRVLTAATGREALTATADAALNDVDLLLTDVVMPEMSGVELAERLTERRPDLPVLFMSGYAEEEMLQRGHLMERVLLEKPFQADALLTAVDGALRASD